MATPLRVIIIEDNELDAELITAYLQLAGYAPQVQRVATGPAFSQALAGGEWDLVLSDFSLPQFGVPAALRILHASGQDLPFIIISGTIGEEQAVNALRAGAHDFVIKDRLTRLAPAIARELREVEVREQRREALAELDVREARAQALLENSSDVITMLNAEGRVIYASPSTERILGYTSQDLVGAELAAKIHPDDLPGVLARLRELVADPSRPATLEYRVRHKDGSWRWVDAAISNMLSEPSVGAIIFNYRDVSARKQAEADTQRRMARQAAQTAIDQAIIGSLDLKVTLHVFLDQAASQLGVDAADVLLLDPYDYALVFAAGRGFHNREFERVRQRVGEGRAGRALMERRLVVGGQSISRAATERTGLLGQEHFASYFGMPLIAKGQALGVLELFHRTPFEANAEWLEFFESLANQAATAVYNASLFDSLQRSNDELRSAFDSSLEGWARAVDLRGQEAEGYNQRVVDLAMRLAEALAVPNAELVHLRRGALLHDVGHLGIPEHILLKPGPLDPEELAAVRRHPVVAQELLSPILALRPALTIPYCHHEKWDGSGYPRQLQGPAIPLAARLFAVVDVWDALCSPRPHRPAWPAEKALEYLQSNAGAHFDPQIVDAFLSLIRS